MSQPAPKSAYTKSCSRSHLTAGKTALLLIAGGLTAFAAENYLNGGDFNSLRDRLGHLISPVASKVSEIADSAASRLPPSWNDTLRSGYDRLSEYWEATSVGSPSPASDFDVSLSPTVDDTLPLFAEATICADTVPTTNADLSIPAPVWSGTTNLAPYVERAEDN